MQRRTFLRISSQSIVASILPGAVSEASEQAPGLDSNENDFQSSVRVLQWQPQDFSFHSKSVPPNPFAVMLSADVTSPRGARFTMPGFYDGKGTWKLRISPNIEGDWSLKTSSTLPELDKRHVTFSCIRNNRGAIHGGLKVDPAHPSQFVYEDGTRFFPMGYECDWLWAMDVGDAQLRTVNPFLDKISELGFNFVILNAFAYDTTWRKGKTGENDYGPPLLYPWEGSNDKPDHSRFSLAYWQHYDKVIDALYRRGIVAHILIRVYNKGVNWPPNGSVADDLYYRWLIARYSAYSNVTWDLAKEAHYEKDLEYKIGRLRHIRASDPYHRLLTVHDDRANYDRGVYDNLLDYRSDQQHTDWRKVMFDHLQQRAWPVINTEFGYECGPKGINDKTYSVAQLPEEVCRRGWEVCMAGGFPAYYYTYTAWDVIRPNDTPPGYGYFKNLHRFFAGTGYWKMKPTEGIVSDGYCLAEAEREYLVFLSEARMFTLTIPGLGGHLTGEWYQPFTGNRVAAEGLEYGQNELIPPLEWGSGPVAFHLIRRHTS